MIRLRRLVDAVLERVLILLMGLMVANVVWQVATRFLLNAPSSYTEELARFLLIWLSLLGAAYAAGRRMHLALDLVPALRGRRAPSWMDVFVQSCILLFAVLVLVIGGLRLVALTLILEQTSAALQIRLGYVYLALPLSGLLVAFYAGMAILERARPAARRRAPVTASASVSQRRLGESHG